ncbi:MAG: urea ABC transporter permease subunit UrtB [Verrucomicrobiota bacterium]|jgi:urea transport system permease protein
MMKAGLTWALALAWCSVQFGVLAAAAPASPSAEEGVRHALTQAILDDSPERARLLDEIARSGSKVAHEVLTAWTRDSVYLYDEPGGAKLPLLLEEQQDGEGKSRAIRIDNGRFLAGADSRELRFAGSDLNPADTDMKLRQSIQRALDTLALADANADSRRSAAAKLGNSGKLQYLPVLEDRLAREPNAEVRRTLNEGIALLQLHDTNAAIQLNAIRRLAKANAIGALDILKRLAASTEAGPEVARAAADAVSSIAEHVEWVNFFGTAFRGLSLGSILLVVALGLAITFGLMGIINMAHGEMIAVGAYTCYLVQNLFGAGFAFSITLPISLWGKPLAFGLHLPGLNAAGGFYETYFLFALPLSFLTAAAAGLILERTVVRFLYRRPLESLLATWGVSLVMQQLFRMVFGANNVQVSSPAWLQGHFSINDVMFGYNRVFVIAFAAFIVLGTWLLLAKTPLGLFIRAVMQNRDMAACLGVRANRVNMLTFAFGSGLAGLAGAFLSQIGNVGPSLGQSYIVDSFMTVVVGGVGSIVGTVCSAMAIGTTDQVLQQTLGSPVLGKIIVLGAIILFLQWKPGGLFSIRNRTLD